MTLMILELGVEIRGGGHAACVHCSLLASMYMYVYVYPTQGRPLTLMREGRMREKNRKSCCEKPVQVFPSVAVIVVSQCVFTIFFARQ